MKHGRKIEFESYKDVPVFFYFTLDHPMMVDVHTWGLNELSDPDLYIAGPKLFSTKEEAQANLRHENCNWKSHNIGPDNVRIMKQDPNMVAGTFWISVIPFCEGIN